MANIYLKTIVSVLHKELECMRCGKAQVREAGDHAAEDQKQIR